MRLKPLDQAGRDLRVGDWVRFTRLPPDTSRMPTESRRAFRKALGLTFRIEAFSRYGFAELDLSRKVAWGETIWVEPEFLLRTRRSRGRAA